MQRALQVESRVALLHLFVTRDEGRKEKSSCSQISDLCNKFSERRDLESFDDPLRYLYRPIAEGRTARGYRIELT